MFIHNYYNTNVTQDDAHQIRHCIKTVIDDNYSSLGSLFTKGSLKTIAICVYTIYIKFNFMHNNY